jgi:hypothetical protein
MGDDWGHKRAIERGDQGGAGSRQGREKIGDFYLAAGRGSQLVFFYAEDGECSEIYEARNPNFEIRTIRVLNFEFVSYYGFRASQRLVNFGYGQRILVRLHSEARKELERMAE